MYIHTMPYSAERYRKAIRILTPAEKVQKQMDALLTVFGKDRNYQHILSNFRMSEMVDFAYQKALDVSIRNQEAIGTFLPDKLNDVLYDLNDQGMVLDVVKDNLSHSSRKEQQAFRAVLPMLRKDLQNAAEKAGQPLPAFLQNPGEIQKFLSEQWKKEIEGFRNACSDWFRQEMMHFRADKGKPVIYDRIVWPVEHLKHADAVLTAFGIQKDLGKILFPDLPRRQQKEAAAAFQAFAEEDLSYQDIPAAEYLARKTEFLFRLHASLPKKLQEEITEPVLTYAWFLGKENRIPGMAKPADQKFQPQK